MIIIPCQNSRLALKAIMMSPVSALRIQGETMRPFYRPKGNGLRDIREFTSVFPVCAECSGRAWRRDPA